MYIYKCISISIQYININYMLIQKHNIYKMKTYRDQNIISRFSFPENKNKI